MKFLLVTFILFLGALIQAVVRIPDHLGGVSCPVLVGIVIYYGLTRPQGVALLVAFFAGMLQDALSPIPLGVSSLCFCVAVWIINRFKDEVFINDWITHVLFGGCVNMGVMVVSFMLLWQVKTVSLSPLAFFVKLMGALAWGCLVVPLVFFFVEHLYGKLGMSRRESAV